MIRTFSMAALAATSLTAFSASLASAQDADAPPSYGVIGLEAGFADDPSSHAVRAGGALSADNVDSSCYGYIENNPTLVLDYEAGSLPLYISAASDEDITLVIQNPDGSWSCNDDEGSSGFNPGVMYDAPNSGPYAIWAGTYAAGVGYPDTMIHISELGYTFDNPFVTSIQPDAPAQELISLQAGFSPDPASLSIQAGGTARADEISFSCSGHFSEAPSIRMNYEAGGFPLFISGVGDFDGTLAVMTPSGDYLCDDDSAGNLNPGVHVEDPESGFYNIWMGTYSRMSPQEGTVHISEIGFGGVDNQLDVTADARHGSGSLASGFAPDPVVIDVTAGGDIDIEQATTGQATAEGFCTGFTSREPAYELTYEAGGFPLYISASSSDDLTIAVNAPDGSWWCNDDNYEEVSPGVLFEDPASGVYDIFVGVYGSAYEAEGQLFISELGFGADASAQPGEFSYDEGGFGTSEETFDLDIFLEPVFGEHDLGSMLSTDPTVFNVSAGGELYANNADTGDAWCTGYISEAATLEITYDGDGPLHIYTESDSDLTLVVNDANGGWVCDGDGGRSVNPYIMFSPDAAGTYDIWVGTYGGGTVDAEVHISETSGPADD